MGTDDLDDLLDTDFELEARFRELQAKVDLEELKRDGGSRRSQTRKKAAPKPDRSAKKAPRPEKKATRAKRSAKTSDPLGDLKSQLDGDKPIARYLLVLCPSCGRKNRVPLARLRAELPVCGACREDLAAVRRS